MTIALLLAWAKAHWRWLAIGVTAFAILFLLAFCRHVPTPIPKKEQHSLDSLDITKPLFDSTQRAAAKAETTFVVKRVEDGKRAAKAERAVDSLKTVADSLERVARASRDTSSVWYGVAKARDAQLDSAGAAMNAMSKALLEADSARALADIRAINAENRYRAAYDLTTRLAKDLAAAEPPCRVLGVLRCPSRTVVAISSIALAAAGTYALTHR